MGSPGRMERSQSIQCTSDESCTKVIAHGPILSDPDYANSDEVCSNSHFASKYLDEDFFTSSKLVVCPIRIRCFLWGTPAIFNRATHISVLPSLWHVLYFTYVDQKSVYY